jgi:hypothetical protein
LGENLTNRNLGDLEAGASSSAASATSVPSTSNIGQNGESVKGDFETLPGADTEGMADDLQAEKPYYTANVQKNIDWLLNTDPVAEIPGNAIKLDALEGKNFVDKIYNLFVRDKTAQVTRGDWKINLSKSGIRASRTKGLGALKINAFAALPQVITKGIITDVNRNWKGRGYDSYFINAPVKIGETDYIVEVIVNRGKNGIGNFYLHEVEKKSKLHGVQQAGMDTRTPEGASRLNIARLLEESNTEKADGIVYIRDNGGSRTNGDNPRHNQVSGQTGEKSSLETLLQLTDEEIQDDALRYPSPRAWR